MRALVTGATSGIGYAVARALHGAGYEVMGSGRNEARLKALARNGIQPLILDLSGSASVSRILAGMQFDVLINNAGMVPTPGHFCAMTESDIHSTVLTNLTSAMVVTRAVAPYMQTQGKGHIVFTGSIAGHQPYRNMAVYAATKAALGGFAQSLRLDLADDGVRVTEIVAGRVQSELYKNVLADDEREKLYADGLAVQPEDVAAMVVAVLALPPHANVARFDILPTRLSAVPAIVPSQKQA
jgi:3-hydroxy acid dehydrogenase / malonic semialdehyde reductase